MSEQRLMGVDPVVPVTAGRRQNVPPRPARGAVLPSLQHGSLRGVRVDGRDCPGSRTAVCPTHCTREHGGLRPSREERLLAPLIGVALPDPCVAQGLRSGGWAFTPQRAETRARWSNPKSQVDRRPTAPFAGQGILVGQC